MTCQELRFHLEDPQRVEAGLPNNSAEIAAHIVICASCSSFLEEQRQLGSSLRLACESVPDVPPELDAAVLGDYRNYVAGKASSARLSPASRRMSLVEALAWTAAVAVAMFIAHEEFGLFFPAEEGVTSTVQTGRTEAPTATQSAAPESVAPSPLEAGHLRTTARAKAKRTVPVPRVAADKPPVLAEVPAPDALPVGFRSLMYCDVLSCGGPMQMIRVQLPPSAAGLAPDSVPSNQMVYADVLVGPDGIARGIRILK